MTSEKVDYGGHEFGNVYFLGDVDSVTSDASKVRLLPSPSLGGATGDSGRAQMDVRVRDESSQERLKVSIFISDPSKAPAVIEGATIRVHGRIRIWQGERNITSFKTAIVPEADVEKAKKVPSSHRLPSPFSFIFGRTQVHKMEVEFASLYWKKDMPTKMAEAQVQAYGDPHGLKGPSHSISSSLGHRVPTPFAGTVFMPPDKGAATTTSTQAAPGASYGTQIPTCFLCHGPLLFKAAVQWAGVGWEWEEAGWEWGELGWAAAERPPSGAPTPGTSRSASRTPSPASAPGTTGTTRMPR